VKINSYRNLIVWQKSVALVTDIYTLTKSFPQEEKFGIVSQLNRASVSIPSNIAEGWGRESSKNYLQFLRISRGSLMEKETLLEISKNLNYINDSEFKVISDNIEEVSKILQGLIKSIQQKIKITQTIEQKALMPNA
jgi:four helix bundle protein